MMIDEHDKAKWNYELTTLVAPAVTDIFLETSPGAILKLKSIASKNPASATLTILGCRRPSLWIHLPNPVSSQSDTKFLY